MLIDTWTGLHAAALVEHFQVLPVAAVDQKRGLAVDAPFHACIELHRGEFVLRIEHAQLAVLQGLKVNVVAWSERRTGGVRLAGLAMLRCASNSGERFGGGHRSVPACRGRVRVRWRQRLDAVTRRETSRKICWVRCGRSGQRSRRSGRRRWPGPAGLRRRVQILEVQALSAEKGHACKQHSGKGPNGWLLRKPTCFDAMRMCWRRCRGRNRGRNRGRGRGRGQGGGCKRGVPQFVEQFKARVALDLGVVEAVALTRFELFQLGWRDGVQARKNEGIDACLFPQTLQQLPLFGAPVMVVHENTRTELTPQASKAQVPCCWA